MAGGGGGGSGREARILDAGTPPLDKGSPGSGGDATGSEGDDGVLYGETQALDGEETQWVEGLEEEGKEAGDWADTQLVQGCGEGCDSVGEWAKTQLVGEREVEEGGDGSAGEIGKTQLVEEWEEEEEEEEEKGGNGCGDEGVGKWGKTQLVEECEEEEEEEKGGNGCGDEGVGEWGNTQLVEECEEEEEQKGGNGCGDGGVGEWGKTQLVEDSDEEIGDDGSGEAREGTQVVSDDEGMSNDGGDVNLGMGGGNGKGNARVVEHDGGGNLVDSDASTDDEGGAGHLRMRLASVRVASVRTCGLAAASKAFTVTSMQQRKQQTLAGETHSLPKILNKSTLGSTSIDEHPDHAIDNDSHGYIQNHEKDVSKSRGSCSTAKKLFADMTPGKDESNTKNVAGLSYIVSQEPGDLSQANALEVVERLISINDGGSSQEATPNKSEIVKSPVSSKNGALMLAKNVDRSRSSNRKADIFNWVNSREDDGGGEFFSKNKDLFLPSTAGKGKSKGYSPKVKKSSMKIVTNAHGKGRGRNETNGKLCEEVAKFPLSDSRLLKSNVKSKRASGNKTKKNLLKDLDDLSNAQSLERQQENANIAPCGVGPDTQMAVEAMEALGQCSPAATSADRGKTPLGRNVMENGNSKRAKSSSKNGPCQKRNSSILEGVTTRSKRTKITKLEPEPQKARPGGLKLQDRSEEPRAKTKMRRTKSAPEKREVPKVLDMNGYCFHGTPVACRTRHSSRNNLFEYTELRSNKHVKKIKNSTGDIPVIGVVENNHIADEPEQPMVSERIEDSSLNNVEKERTEHASANNAQNLEPCRDEPITNVACRDSSSHPKQRRTATAMVHTKARAAPLTTTDHGMPPEAERPSKKRRVFIRSVSDLLKNAKRERSSGRAISTLASIISKSSFASPVFNSSVRVDTKTSTGSTVAGKQQKGPSYVGDASKSPKSIVEVPNSVPKTPSKVINELSPTFSPLNPSKSSSRSLSKPSVARELLRLDPDKPLSNRQLKDSRRRKDMASACILFSHHLDEDVIKRQKETLARLGVREAFSISDATHFVADSFFRTKNMLEAIALGKPIVTSMWLENCGQVGCFVDEKKFILRDAKKEKEIGFSMPSSLASAREHPLLQGIRVFVTPNIKPSRELLTSLVMASSGQPVERIGRSIMKEQEVPEDLLVLSCEEDYEACVPLLERGAVVFSLEFLLNGIVIQKLEYERHRLFSDQVKRTRTTTWVKDKVRGQFVPVSKCS